LSRIALRSVRATQIGEADTSASSALTSAASARKQRHLPATWGARSARTRV